MQPTLLHRVPRPHLGQDCLKLLFCPRSREIPAVCSPGFSRLASWGPAEAGTTNGLGSQLDPALHLGISVKMELGPQPQKASNPSGRVAQAMGFL
jgi:hypothetical protein